ncbi:replication protein A 70 kDa DNA-binding subunit B [Tanacetum coccineum]|uniref:Replication protein A 70 kDa DNA-binding subunit B n=1 Tax=Tanacetum coccineum TaxID=301880 RepID=A0ABQ5I0L7_9ASTR
MQAIRQSQRLSKSNKEKNFGVSVLNRESSSTGGQSEQKNNKKRSHSSSLAKSMEQPKKSKLSYAPAKSMEQLKKSKLSYAPAKSMEQLKKSKLSYAPDCDFEANRGSKSKTGLDFARKNGSNTLHLSSNMVCMNSNNATRSALKSPLKRNNGKNVSTFESSPQAPKMKERIITPIKDINPMIANMAIRGRCISVWHSHKLNEIHDPYSLDCVFQDEEKISFYKGTEVTRIDQIDDNIIVFVNEPFLRILDTNNDYHDHDCVDVIGTVVSIGDIVPINGYGCSKVRRTVVIEDTQSLRLECTFWDKWALMWNEYAEKLDEVGHLDFVLMLGKIKYWNNKPAIHNALFGTRIYINKDITPLQSFRKSYEANSGYNASEFKIEIHNPDIHVVTPAEFMQGCLRKMVGMIRDIEPNHGETYAVVSRFKIIVRIFDESGSAQVVLFDNNVYKMTKLSAWQIMEEQGMDADLVNLHGEHLCYLLRRRMVL